MSENILWRSVVKWRFNLQGYSNCSSHRSQYNSGSLLLLAAIVQVVAALAQCARARPTYLAVEPRLLSIFDLSTKMYRGRQQQRGANRGRASNSRGRGSTSTSSNSFPATPLPATTNVSINNNSPIITSQVGQCSSIGLEELFEQTRVNTGMIKRIDGHVKSLEDKTTQVATAVKELNDLLRKQQKDSFSIKGSRYEVSRLFVKWLSLAFNLLGTTKM